MSQSSNVQPTARIAEGPFLGILWTGTGLSLCFVAFRLFVKIKSFRTLYSDDYLVIAAWSILFATATLWQIKAPIMYMEYAMTSGRIPSTPENLEKYFSFTPTITAFTILFYSCLWSIKLSFLFFFRRLGSRAKGKTWWWCILVITVLSWIVCVADFSYSCSLGSIETLTTYCVTESFIQRNNRKFYANCALDVITDCLIISIPVLMLWHVRVPLGQKLILLGIFSLTVIVMIVAIIRVAVVNSVHKDADISWLYLWSNIEMATAILIACLASFRQLFVNVNGQQAQAIHSRSTSRWGLLSYFQSRGKSSTKSSSQTKWPDHSSEPNDPSKPSESQTHIIPLDSILVSHNIAVSSANRRQSEEV